MAGRQLDRRSFFGFLGIGWAMFTAAMGSLGALAFRFTYPNVNFEPEMDFVAGKPEDFEEGVDERFKNGYGVWMVRQEGRLVALSNICTHLGCIPTWMPADLKFKCPCHGSGYYMNGVNFEGPAPRPLERYRITTLPDGRIRVDKTRLFRHEKGEWDHPDSYIEV